jgi:hypothetical protein
MQAHDSNEYDNEMEIYNLDDIEIVEGGGAQILTRHQESSQYPKLDHKPLITLHPTRLLLCL